MTERNASLTELTLAAVQSNDCGSAVEVQTTAIPAPWDVANGDPNLSRLIRALLHLDPDCDYETWANVRLASLVYAARQYPDWAWRLKYLALAWSSGQLRGKAAKTWTKGCGYEGPRAGIFDREWQCNVDAIQTGSTPTLCWIYSDAAREGFEL